MTERRLALLAVGDELLAGDRVDTNSAALARMGRDHGWRAVGVAVVGDVQDDIERAVFEARRAADALVVTGGLGPTQDDLTRHGVAAAFGLGLERRPELVERLRAFFESIGRPFSESNLQQCDMPEGATVLENPRGTAAGFLVRDARGGAADAARDFAVACLPGPPSEMRPMAEALFATELGADGARMETRKVSVFGPTEAELGELLADVMGREADAARDALASGGEAAAVASRAVVGITASQGVLTVSVRGRGAEVVDPIAARVAERLGAQAFSVRGEGLAEVVVRLLTERGETVSAAESCTGGLLAGEITSVSGASEVLRESVVTYANDAKQARLGVPRELLAEHGAVSEEVAAAMARGQRERGGADWALGVTGIAGPTGGTEGKPVGTVCFGLAGPAGVTVTRTVRVHGPRDWVRRRSVFIALDMLRRALVQA